jgi:hypothetical protein
MTQKNYNAEEETEELIRVGKLPKPLRLAAMLEKSWSKRRFLHRLGRLLVAALITAICWMKQKAQRVSCARWLQKHWQSSQHSAWRRQIKALANWFLMAVIAWIEKVLPWLFLAVALSVGTASVAIYQIVNELSNSVKMHEQRLNLLETPSRPN